MSLAHEVAHVWRGLPGIFNGTPCDMGAHNEEQFCNAVAAELLVPNDLFIKSGGRPLEQQLRRLRTRLLKSFRYSTALDRMALVASAAHLPAITQALSWRDAR